MLGRPLRARRRRLVAGSRTVAAATAIGIPSDRAYPTSPTCSTPKQTARRGRRRGDHDPNDSHHRYAVAVLRHGFDVICDKPVTNTLDEAREVVAHVEETGLVFCVTHNYTGYPMVRQAQRWWRLVSSATIQLIQVEYVQGGKAAERDPDHDPAVDGALPWRYDPVRGGPSLVLGDIGTHVDNLVRFVTGREIDRVRRRRRAIVANRLIDDFAGAMLRFDNGARGSFWATRPPPEWRTVCACGCRAPVGTLEWMQESRRTSSSDPWASAGGGPYAERSRQHSRSSVRASRIVAGHPEGFHEGFANVYSDAAEAIAARRTGNGARPDGTSSRAVDGLRGVAFVEAAVRSSADGGAWTAIEERPAETGSMTTPQPGPPSGWVTAGEALSGLQAIRLIGQTPRLARTPRWPRRSRHAHPRPRGQ